MSSFVDSIATQVGIHPDLLKIALCIVLSFPLGSLVKRIPSRMPLVKDSVVIFIGMFYLSGIFSLYKEALFMICLSILTYALATVFPRNKHMPWFNFTIQMGFMLYTHCLEQFSGGDYVNNIGISGTQMIIIQKLTSFAWNVYDNSKPDDQLSAYQKEMRISSRPSFLRFLAWVFFFPTLMTGPACTYHEYDIWANEKIFGNTKPQPRCGALILRRLGEGLIWIVLYMKTGYLSSDNEFYLKDWYVSRSFLFKATSLWILGFLYRTKYYAAWTMSEAACMHIGFSYNGIDSETGKVRWDRMSNIRPVGVEFGQNIRGVLADWNIITASWLRNYVYLRVVKEGKKPGARATYITFLVSALWHGTRPGYYLTFITAAFYQIFGKIYRRNLRPIFVGTKFKAVYDILTWLVTQYALGYAAMPFMLLNFTPAFIVWASVYFYIFVGLAISWILLSGPLRKFVLPSLRKLQNTSGTAVPKDTRKEK
ncbi:lysophospholipid acyltransferase [Starmerella bacillaris]|uniref:Lysophospholipid acyltransferase n=1 Tax=Starmerella bacillaris TaxID=1247836 RepID=A0AAV5RKX6_STABA|nr:lysophospholipid acyltransferase [Starmerella bacillaris]